MATPDLTKREYFAAIALQGILANKDTFTQTDEITAQSAASLAVKAADALISEMNHHTRPPLGGVSASDFKEAIAFNVGS